MYLMYVDESGDIGIGSSPTPFFVLSGLVVHENKWSDTLDALIGFRRRMKDQFGLKLREEIHASHLLVKPRELARIRRNDRLSIIRHFADEIASLGHLRLITVIVNKRSKGSTYDVFDNAWRALIQRFENTLGYGNFPGGVTTGDKGIIVPDATDVKKLTQLIRRLRRYNPIPNQQQYGQGYRNVALRNLIEDPVFRDSADSYFIQAADLCAFLAYQREQPMLYMRKKGAANYYRRMTPIYCLHASPHDPDGVVRL